MSITIGNQILNEMEARLGNIAIADGYFTDVVRIERARLTPFKTGDLPAINIWSSVDQLIKSGGGWEERRLTVMVEYHNKTRDRPFNDVAEELAADVWIALWRATTAGAVTDNPSSHLGGLVTGMLLESVVPEIGEGQAPYCGALLEIAVLYKRRPDTPFTIVT